MVTLRNLTDWSCYGSIQALLTAFQVRAVQAKENAKSRSVQTST
jgi:hypothetical protein